MFSDQKIKHQINKATNSAVKFSKTKHPRVRFAPYDTAILIEKLKIIYDEKTPTELVALKNFSYDFKRGKIYFIVGNSGSGKTTLVSHFNGLSKTKYGNIYVEDIPILGKTKRIKQFKELRKTVGMVFQFPEYQLFKDTVEKDIMFGPVALGSTKIVAKQRAKHYLNKMGMPDEFLERSPFGLSGGQKRRVAIAGILAIEPSMLVFDEPTAGLDPAGEREMLDIIIQAKTEKKTVFVITHVMDQVLELADEVIVLHNNQLLASGTPYEIFTNQKILETTTLDLPKVIKVIKSLIEKDARFEPLMKLKPRNVNELVRGINSIISKR